MNSLPKLAEIFHVSIDDLMQGTAAPQKESKAKAPNGKRAEILPLALKSVALAMGVAVAILSFIKEIGTGEALSMLGIGLFCLALAQFLPKD